MLIKVILFFVVTIQKCFSMEVFLNEWSMKIIGGKDKADLFALKNGFVNLGEIIPGSNEYHMKIPRRPKRSIFKDKYTLKKLESMEMVSSVQQLVEHIRVKRDEKSLTAPLRNNQWHLHSNGDLDMGVAAVWTDGGSGKGVKVTIVDDGIEKDHPDLSNNYDPQSSFDVNENDSDPQPRYGAKESNNHGTRCAGQVAASGNSSSLCTVGIAFNAKIGGIKLLDGIMSDATEARALSFNQAHIDVYSCSWGPADNGKTVDGPGRITSQAIHRGIQKGRGGKGNIFVFASGNGGEHSDDCNCDGYIVSINTITISSVTQSGKKPHYSEACTSIMAAAFSSGSPPDRQISTTDIHHRCTSSHTGSSASAPIASGIIALTLEANPDLTWRDVQHLIVRTSRHEGLQSHDWIVNGVGRNVSKTFGYGLLDARAMVKEAQNWKLVPEQESCEVEINLVEARIEPLSVYKLEINVTECNNIKYLEHVVLPLNLVPGLYRGNHRIELTSPSGTRSVLLSARRNDKTQKGFKDWPFMTVHAWGEDPTGIWTLEVFNTAPESWAPDTLLYVKSMKLYGIAYDPNLHQATNASLEFYDESTDLNTKLSDLNNQTKPIYHAEHIKGCIDVHGTCTSDTSRCMTIYQRLVAMVLFQCIPGCTGLESQQSAYLLKCLVNENEPDKTSLFTEAIRRSEVCRSIISLQTKQS